MAIGIVVATERAIEEGTPVLNVKCDLGGGEVVTAQWFGGAGDDAVPMPDDFVHLAQSSGTGTWLVAGVFDPTNAGTTEQGERRVYARDQNGAPIAELHLKKDGNVSIKGLGAVACELTFDPAGGRVTVTCATYVVDADSVRIGKGPGRQIACVGDLVAVVVPILNGTAPGTPVVPANPAAQLPTGYAAAGQIISGRTTVQAGP